ncbi:phosphatase PAP2 family protein [Caulobacter segnis]|uniref:Acid phosphatase n=2 Tax=Caulobacter segnis TaxID=88688 RepID=D5VHV1_CAUST|nr:acid phosphatase [Caulobacter segnis ATCC 21756]AVQ00905.1 phosphatase PAP2 family protein [Caulobacter segnis]
MLNLLAALAVVAAPCPASDESASCVRQRMDALPMNDLMAVGTHNSYKQAIPADEMAAMVAARGQAALGVDYGHRRLAEQLDAGARQLELDVVADPEGGRYAKPLTVFGQGTALPPEMAAALAKPGFKTMHMTDVDFRVSCVTFVACLKEVRAWSDAHRDHAPILIMINAKEGEATVPGGVKPLPFTESLFDAFDAEIRSVFGDDRLVTPDQVQGKAKTLREAVLAGGWPKIGQARGKVFFALDEGPAKVAIYRGKRASLEGRAMFVNTDEASPAAAYLTLNDPVAQKDRIAAAVKAGFIVRTRADADTWEARRNDVTRRTAAFTSGAQYVSTDYIWPDPRFPGGYTVRLTGGDVAVCNPVREPKACDNLAIEALPGAPMRGYLAPEARPDLTKILAAPPQPGSPRAIADAAIFDQSRAIKDKDPARWAEATADVSGPAFGHFEKALGVKLTAQNAPILSALLERAGDDRSVVGVAKSFWGTKRPYVGKDSAPVCEPKRPDLTANPDYPSGHSAFGGHVAMILAEVVPSRADALYARGRDYADSRWICGSHSLSAAEAGLQSGEVIYAAEHRSETFLRDIAMARAEVAAVMAAGQGQ